MANQYVLIETDDLAEMESRINEYGKKEPAHWLSHFQTAVIPLFTKVKLVYVAVMGYTVPDPPPPAPEPTKAPK